MGKRSRRERDRVVRWRDCVLGSRDFATIRRLIRRNRGLLRSEIAERVCKIYGWRQPNGELSKSSCLFLLKRLERYGFLQLPLSVRRSKGRTCRAIEGDVVWPSVSPESQAATDSGDLLVRLTRPEELPASRAWMQRFHYLGDCALIGESLRYAAFYRGEVVALLWWSAAALHNRPRDVYIGWDSETKKRRLSGVVNNSRFLMLPWSPEELFASQVLAANLRRLNRDWQTHYSHAIQLAETFVATPQFQGTCYRASNWLELGETQGWSRDGASYRHHGQRKKVFVYALARRAVEELKTVSPAKERQRMTRAAMLDVWQLPMVGKDSLFEALAKISDPRHRRGIRHSLQSVLAMAVCATLAGSRSLVAIAEWARDLEPTQRKLLGGRLHRSPGETTFRRTLGLIDVKTLDQVIGEWLLRRQKLTDKAIALDGKTLRGSRDGEVVVHLVSAILHAEGVVVQQERVGEKTNEITSVKPLLENLDIAGAVVTADALHTQTETAKFLVDEKAADYVFTVKDNQPTLRSDIELLFDPKSLSPSALNDK